jgi:hypothetical protein
MKKRKNIAVLVLTGTRNYYKSAIATGCYLWQAASLPLNRSPLPVTSLLSKRALRFNEVLPFIQPYAAFPANNRADSVLWLACYRDAPKSLVIPTDRVGGLDPANASVSATGQRLPAMGWSSGPIFNHTDHSVQKSPPIRELAYRKCVAGCFYFDTSVFTGEYLREKASIKLARVGLYDQRQAFGNRSRTQSQPLKISRSTSGALREKGVVS